MRPEELEVMDAAEAVSDGFERGVSIVRLLELYEHFRELDERLWMQQVSDVATVAILRSITRVPLRM